MQSPKIDCRATLRNLSTRPAGSNLLRLQFEYLTPKVPEWRLETTIPQWKSMQWPCEKRGHEKKNHADKTRKKGGRKTHPRATTRRPLVVAGSGAPCLRGDLSLKVGGYQERKGTCHRHAGPVLSSRHLQRGCTRRITVQHLQPFGCSCLGVFNDCPVADCLSQLNSIRATGLALSSCTWESAVWATVHHTLVVDHHWDTGRGRHFAVCHSSGTPGGRGDLSGGPLARCPLHQTVLCTARSGHLWEVTHTALSDGILGFQTQTLQLAENLREGGPLLWLLLPGGPHQLVHVTGAALR